MQHLRKRSAGIDPPDAAMDVAAATRLGIPVMFTRDGPDSISELM